MPELGVEEHGAKVRVHLAEQFTPHVAGALQRLARRVPLGTILDLDFSGVRECHDVALLLLARDVIAGTARYVFHGLTHHQTRLLGYLGAQVERALEPEAT